MNKLVKQILIISATLIVLLPLVYFTYPQITGSTVLIKPNLLEDEGWTLTKTNDTTYGQINYYTKDEQELVIRIRSYPIESDAMNSFAGHYNLKSMKDPQYFKYKDQAFHAIYINNFGIGAGPWLIFTVLDGKNLAEFIYTNEAGKEYSGDYDKDVEMLKEIAIKTLGK